MKILSFIYVCFDPREGIQQVAKDPIKVEVFMKYAFLFLLLGFLAACTTNHVVNVGDARVIIKEQHYGQGKAFVHVHQNEKTALKAAKTVIKSEGGSLLTLVHSGDRNIVFNWNQKRYEFDPNRIFTDVGIKETLLQFGPYSKGAHVEVQKLANTIKQLLPEGKIIAVHNNETYSLKNYFHGRPLAADSRALYINGKESYRNFYYVTKKNEYLRLKKLKFNSILQARHVIDDGSLSVYLAHRDYINVEAGYDQLAIQIEMLKFA